MQEFFLPRDCYVIDTEAKQMQQNVQNMMDSTASSVVLMMAKRPRGFGCVRVCT